MTGAVTIRSSTLADRPAVLAVVGRAFSDEDRDGSEEVRIVTATWESGQTVFELVAVDDGEIVGHVLAAEGDLGARSVAAIAPLAVAPGRQGAGVGTALMTELLRMAEEAGLPLVVLLGNPAYYGRFGFEPSGPLGITYDPAGDESPNFQVRRLSNYDPALRGHFVYHWERSPG